MLLPNNGLKRSIGRAPRQLRRGQINFIEVNLQRHISGNKGMTRIFFQVV